MKIIEFKCCYDVELILISSIEQIIEYYLKNNIKIYKKCLLENITFNEGSYS